MTEPVAAATPERAAMWEDFLEIFIKPAAVFERRKAAGFIVPLLVLTVVFGLLFFGLKGAFQPIMQAENARAIAKVIAKNPQLTEEMRDAMTQRAASGGKLAPIFATVFFPVAVLLIGLSTWLAGKMVGAVTSLGAVYSVLILALVMALIGFVLVYLLAAAWYWLRYRLVLNPFSLLK